ncbi:PD-(D/E)XK motif protein [Malacoplasma penetrans]|uniref:PD-(D/E)XK motif protein n=1 Tax=Malacoplasma penetrans TaxID=28227 RepID=UPI0010123C8B|nr:PD-(D/E)XK motif protein [Malacoplasma penetrans]RXY96822.1 PD-(D/E)XK motif protein [Malacoplasma penetrans]
MNFKKECEDIVNLKNYNPKTLYLVKVINDTSGFLFLDGSILFISKSKSKHSIPGSTTKFLDLKIHQFIRTEEINPFLKNDFYDLLIYKSIDEDKYLNSFIELCKLYEQSDKIISFEDFFNSLTLLFSPEKTDTIEDVIGLFGELYLIWYLNKYFNFSIKEFWHNGWGTNDHYDFALNNFNVEVKTTLGQDMRILIKHEQVFNFKNNYICIVNVKNDNSGDSIFDICKKIRENREFNNDIQFMTKLEKEILRVNRDDYNSKKFSVVKLNFYKNKDLKTLENIPEMIDSIKYYYDFIGQPKLSLDELKLLFKNH